MWEGLEVNVFPAAFGDGEKVTCWGTLFAILDAFGCPWRVRNDARSLSQAPAGRSGERSGLLWGSSGLLWRGGRVESVTF